MKKLFNFILLISLFSACKDVYEAPPKSLLETKLIFSNSAEGDTLPITVHGVDKDSFIIYQEVTDMFRMPLSRGDSTAFVVWFDTVPDTLLIKHETTLAYESLETGFYTEHFLTGIEHTFNRIDSVVITDSTVTKYWDENIQLYINDLSDSGN